jgi:heme/copper-type cytochrome/quinol oxidase subunit 2
MSPKNDSNYVSVWSWFWMMFVVTIPVIGLIMIFVWAFVGENESRKNYFRAILLWMLVSLILVAGLVLACLALGTLPAVMNHLHNGSNRM